MSKKKKNKQAKSGLYALCITVGVFIGLGLGPIFNNVLLMLLLGGISGFLVAAYLGRKHR